LRPDLKSTSAGTAGFTLAEMAIVMVIASLLIVSVVSTLTTQVDARNNAETLSRLNQIRDALIGFAQANGRLPCPADGTLVSGAATAGLEPAMVGNACPVAAKYAVLPWAALGMPETDVWGRRFSYYVDPSFADLNAAGTWGAGCGAGPVPVPVAPASFALCSTGALTVKTKTAANKAGTSISVPAVVISHGKNGYGAYTSDGKQFGVLPPNTTDEYFNTPAAASTTTYMREQTPPTTPCSDTAAGNFCEFDDLVVYVPGSLLATRMVSAGKLP
jgi:prepilin-type N-terminal cleavage/methylation domain-containing protein